MARSSHCLKSNYLFTDVMPREDEVAETLAWTPKILERKSVRARVYERVRGVIDTFINGMQGFKRIICYE